MVTGNPRHGADTLRLALQTGTRELHDRLDAAMGHAVLCDQSYARFLMVQYAARASLEHWGAQHMPADLQLPETAALVSQDLAELHVDPPERLAFTLPAGGDPLGIAWAMGGSALGNKVLLAQRRRAGFFGADRFLRDATSAAYFRRLLPRLEGTVTKAEADGAVLAASAVFETFLAAAARTGLRAAA